MLRGWTDHGRGNVVPRARLLLGWRPLEKKRGRMGWIDHHQELGMLHRPGLPSLGGGGVVGVKGLN